MIETGTAYYQGKPLTATNTPTGTVYRSEPLITRAAARELDPIECPDCGHDVNSHASSGCYLADGDDNPLCLCRMSPDDIGETIETDQEGQK